MAQIQAQLPLYKSDNLTANTKQLPLLFSGCFMFTSQAILQSLDRYIHYLWSAVIILGTYSLACRRHCHVWKVELINANELLQGIWKNYDFS